MHADFIRATLLENPRLFDRIEQFNLHPARSLHPDHRPAGLAPQLFAQLVASPRGERHVSLWLESAHGLDPRGCWDFAPASWRVALLPPDELQRLEHLCAAAEQHAAIATLVEGAQIRAVRQLIGVAGYEFALRRAPLLAGPVAAAPAGTPRTDDLPAALAEAGRRALAVCLAGAPSELLRRVALRLPADRPLAVRSSGDAEQARTWRRVRRILASEFDPEWGPCWN